MKQILIIVGIILPLLLFGGCQTEQQKVESKFEHDLRGLYSDVQAITSQAQTRSIDGEWIPPTEEELEVIFAEIARIAEENGVAEQVLASGYYQNIETLNLAEMDMYETLQWIEANGTPEFYELMLEVGEELNIEQIISNPNLLPNEKLGLITGTGVFTDDGRAGGGLGGITIGGGDDTDPDETPEDCTKTYRRERRDCKIAYESNLIAGIGIGAAGGSRFGGLVGTIVGGVLGAIAAKVEYDTCVDLAGVHLDDCLADL